MLNGLAHIPAIRMAALTAAGAALAAAAALTTAPTEATTNQAGGCPILHTADSGSVAHSLLFRPASCH